MRRLISKAILILGICIGLNLHVSAQILGVGIDSCGSWTQDRRDENIGNQIMAAAKLAWVQGFLSAQYQVDTSIRNLSKGEFEQDAILWPDGRREPFGQTPAAIV